MKIAAFVIITYCLQYILCAPTSLATNSTNGESNVAKIPAFSDVSSDVNDFLSTSINRLLNPVVQKSAKQLQKSTTTSSKSSNPFVEAVLSALKNTLTIKAQQEIQIEQLKETIKTLEAEIKTLKEENKSTPSGYALPVNHNQYVVPEGIIIELIEQSSANTNAYVQPHSYNSLRRH